MLASYLDEECGLGLTGLDLLVRHDDGGLLRELKSFLDGEDGQGQFKQKLTEIRLFMGRERKEVWEKTRCTTRGCKVSNPTGMSDGGADLGPCWKVREYSETRVQLRSIDTIVQIVLVVGRE